MVLTRDAPCTADARATDMAVPLTGTSRLRPSPLLLGSSVRFGARAAAVVKGFCFGDRKASV